MCLPPKMPNVRDCTRVSECLLWAKGTQSSG